MHNRHPSGKMQTHRGVRALSSGKAQPGKTTQCRETSGRDGGLTLRPVNTLEKSPRSQVSQTMGGGNLKEETKPHPGLAEGGFPEDSRPVWRRKA